MTDIATMRLDCGTPLVVESIPGVRSAAFSWLLPCGAASDPEQAQGFAPMWAELLMRGAGALDSRAHADALDRLGVNRSTEVGTFYLSIAATMLGARLVEALPLLVDMVLSPRMDAHSIEPARELAIASIESLADEPQERAILACRARHLPAPINRSGMGTIDGLNAITRESLVSRWQQLARPRGSIIAAAGAVDAAALAGALNTLLSRWSGQTSLPELSGTPARGYAHEIDQTNQVQIFVMHEAPPEPREDSLLEKTVLSVLSGGMSGRLFSEVREKRGLCYSVSAGYRGDRDHGAVTAYVGTTPERAQESLDVLLTELDRINRPAGRVTADEFDRAIVGMKSRLVFSGESTAARAGAIATDLHKFGRARSLEELTRQIDSLTPGAVNAYLERRQVGRMTIQTLGPAALRAP